MSKQVILTIPDSVDLSALREMKVILRYYKDGNDLYEYSTDSFSLSEAKGDLISREALKEALFLACDTCRHCPHNSFEDIIDNAPAFNLDDFYGKAFRNGEANALATRGIDNSVIGIATVGYEAAKKKYEPIRCRDCKYQIKEFRSDKREKDGGHYVYACKRFGEMFGYWGWGGKDNEFCSDAERKGGAENE